MSGGSPPTRAITSPCFGQQEVAGIAHHPQHGPQPVVVLAVEAQQRLVALEQLELGVGSGLHLGLCLCRAQRTVAVGSAGAAAAAGDFA